MKIKINELKDLVGKALAKYGYGAEEIKVISEVLFYASSVGTIRVS
jgi:LDH2 family malate/lactate/ureidoglycolate dehydrogenase